MSTATFNNVIVFGAGASADAEVPMMGTFVEKMWRFALKSNLSRDDHTLFWEANKIREELDNYHGRAYFNDRNIEDILSLLVFEAFETGNIDKLDLMTRAIARTIELTCVIKSNYSPELLQTYNYTRFWNSLFKWHQATEDFPTLITFNYDLVLERTLWGTLVGKAAQKTDLKMKTLSLLYYHTLTKQFHWEVKKHRNHIHGYLVQKLEEIRPTAPSALIIEILKLHGSLNFPKESGEKTSLKEALQNPHILPPIFNKFSGQEEEAHPFSEMWKIGLKRLRRTRNIIIVGYSLPQTDIYLQYFLKAAIGPNKGLNKIIVFNPTLYENNELNQQMRERYAKCFSPQIQDRIVFKPGLEHPLLGTFEHFVQLLDDSPEEILFSP